MKNSFFIFLLFGASVFPAFAEEDSICRDDCKRNYSTTPAEALKCEKKCDGITQITPVVIDSINADAPDREGNSGNKNKN